MEDKKKKEQERRSTDPGKQKKEKPIPKADNAGKLVNSGRSQSKEDRQVKDKVTGAEFEGPPY